MSKAKKYDYRVVQDGASWGAEITRRISRQKTRVSKQQAGFATEAEAQAWAEAELKTFLLHQAERNKRRAKTRE